MAWTIQDRDVLKRAIARGVRVANYQDRRIEYRSLKEMLDTLNMMEEELGLRKPVGRVYMSSSKGVRS